MPESLSQRSEPLPTGPHEWYWGSGRPCCVNCGALARCEHQYERNRVDTELRDYLARCRDALAMIASMPTTERNPDGLDQAAWSMQLVAQTALGDEKEQNHA